MKSRIIIIDLRRIRLYNLGKGLRGSPFQNSCSYCNKDETKVIQIRANSHGNRNRNSCVFWVAGGRVKNKSYPKRRLKVFDLVWLNDTCLKLIRLILLLN